VVLFTAVSGIYQAFLPVWASSARRLWPGIELECIVIGEKDEDSLKEVAKYDCNVRFESYGQASCMRFCARPFGNGLVMVTDVDVVFTNAGLTGYLNDKLEKNGGVHGAFRGAKKHPKRPEIVPNGWVGDFQRVTGGFVLFAPEWYKATIKVRDDWYREVVSGMWGRFREADEVMLARMIKAVGLKMPDNTGFHPSYRGIHLGDYRESMRHRWTNSVKMGKLLHEDSITGYREWAAENGGVIEFCRQHGHDVLWANLETHLKTRKGYRGCYGTMG
jgi:hypothetical protein